MKPGLFDVLAEGFFNDLEALRLQLEVRGEHVSSGDLMLALHAFYIRVSVHCALLATPELWENLARSESLIDPDAPSKAELDKA
jgi:hypothetical protein